MQRLRLAFGEHMVAAAASPSDPSVSNRQVELERIAAERLVSEREAERISRRALLRTCVECVAWCGVGLVFFFFGFYVNDVQLGWALVWGGMAVAYGGMSWSLLSAYRRGEERGDW